MDYLQADNAPCNMDLQGFCPTSAKELIYYLNVVIYFFGTWCTPPESDDCPTMP